jgi:hypothetical protein
MLADPPHWVGKQDLLDCWPHYRERQTCDRPMAERLLDEATRRRRELLAVARAARVVDRLPPLRGCRIVCPAKFRQAAGIYPTPLAWVPETLLMAWVGLAPLVLIAAAAYLGVHVYLWKHP